MFRTLLHYVSTIPCKTLNAHQTRAKTLSCCTKKLRNLFQLNCGPQICQILSIWIQRVGLLQEKVYKIRIGYLDKLKQRLRTERAKLDHIVIAAAIHQRLRR